MTDESATDENATNDVAGPVVDIDGTFNSRDVGGHQTTSGERMRTGLLYRSASLDGLGPAGRADLQRLGVQTVVDLRMASELKSHGRFDPADSGIAWVHLDSKFGPPVHDKDEITRVMEMDDPMAMLYPQMLRDAASMFNEGLRMVAAADPLPMIIHCTSGKDRTGMFAVFVQLLCDVPFDAVLSDYEQTGKSMATLGEDMGKRYPEMSAFGREKLMRMASADRAWVVAAMDSIGGVDSLGGWLTSIGVTAEHQAAVRNRFVS